MRLFMSCAQLHPDPGLPFRDDRKEEADDINALIQQFGRHLLRYHCR